MPIFSRSAPSNLSPDRVSNFPEFEIELPDRTASVRAAVVATDDHKAERAQDVSAELVCNHCLKMAISAWIFTKKKKQHPYHVVVGDALNVRSAIHVHHCRVLIRSQ